MEAILENKMLVGVTILFILMFFVGGLINREMNYTNSVTETTSISM